MSCAQQITSIDDLSDGDISRLFYVAKNILNTPLEFRNKLAGKQIMLAFFESSTRTRLSFEMASNMLGARVLNFYPQVSSQNKGESNWDTIKTLCAMSPDVLVIRQANQLKNYNLSSLNIKLINAGDSICEHPTQALLDCFTLLNKFKTPDLSNKKILFCGDINRSRVFNSNFKLMSRLQAKIKIMRPKILGDISQVDYENFEDIHESFDAVIILRVQEERMNNNKFERTKYFHEFGLSQERFDKLGRDCLLMHPGPMIHQAEIDNKLGDHERSLVLTQVRMGVIMRAALLLELCSYGSNL